MKKSLAFLGVAIFLYWFFVVAGYRLYTIDPAQPLIGADVATLPTATATPAPAPMATASTLGAYYGAFSDLWWYAFWLAWLVLPVAGIWAAINRWLLVPARLRWADRFTGLHPIEVKPGAGIIQRAAGFFGLGPAVNEVVNNYNLGPAPTYAVKRHGEALRVVADGHGYEGGDVLGHAQKHIGIRQTVARSAGGPARNPNRAMLLHESGYFEQMTREKQAKADYAAHKLNEATRPPDEPAPAPAVELLTMKQAVMQSTPRAWIMGQNPETGRLATFDPRSMVHMAILGATGTGKTESSGMLAVGYALRFGYQTIVLDGKDSGDDWSFIARWATYHSVEPATFLAHLQAIYAEYKARAQAIRAAGVQWFDELPQAPRPWFVLIEEYGDLNDNMAPADKAAATGILTTLVRKARSTGIHLCFIDQYPEKWDPQILMNTKTKIVYWLQDGGIVKQWKVSTLAPAGEFYMSGERFSAWHARPKMGKWLATVKAAPAPMLTVNLPADPDQDGAQDAGALVETFAGDVRGSFAGGVRDVLPVVAPTPQATREHANAPDPARPKWWDWVYSYMNEHPDLWQIPPKGITEMARQMSRLETGSPDEAARYKGIASDLCRRIRAEYGHYRPAGDLQENLQGVQDE